jgi:hypothetical protein
MYSIYESDLYYKHVILEAAKIPKLTDEEIPPVKEELPKDIPEELPEELPEDLPPEEPPMGKKIPEDLSPEEGLPMGEEIPEEPTESDKFKSIQKFILYHKLRELQYKLDDLSVVNSYKNKNELVKFNKFLSYVITFFSIFDYKQASKLTERILQEFKKIK